MKRISIVLLFLLTYSINAMEREQESLAQSTLLIYKLMPYLSRQEHKEILKIISECPTQTDIPETISGKISDIVEYTVSSIEEDPVQIKKFPIVPMRDDKIVVNKKLQYISLKSRFLNREDSIITLEDCPKFLFKAGCKIKGNILLFRCYEGNYLWNLTTGKSITRLKKFGDSKPVLSESGHFVALVNDKENVMVLSTQNPEEIVTFENSAPIKKYGPCAVISKDDTLIITSTCIMPTNYLQLWDRLTKNCKMFPGHLAAISDDNRLIAAANNEHVAIYDVCIHTLLKQLNFCNCPLFLKFSPNGNRVSSRGQNRDELYDIWDVQSGESLYSEPKSSLSHKRTANKQLDSVVINGSSLYTDPNLGDYELGKPITLLNLLSKKVITLAKKDHRFFVFDPTGHYLLTDGIPNKAELHNAKTGALITLLSHNSFNQKPIFSADGKQVMTIFNKQAQIHQLYPIDWSTISEKEKGALWVLENNYNKGLPINAAFYESLNALKELAKRRYIEFQSVELGRASGNYATDMHYPESTIQRLSSHCAEFQAVVSATRVVEGPNKGQCVGDIFGLEQNKSMELPSKASRILYHLLQKKLREQKD